LFKCVNEGHEHVAIIFYEFGKENFQVDELRCIMMVDICIPKK